MGARSLTSLLGRIPGARLHGRDRVVPAFSADSRRIGPGDVFVAIPGVSRDGRTFIADARARGAGVIVAAEPPPADLGELAWLETTDPALALAGLAAAFHADPAEAVRVLATTGTNGKTTTSFLLQAILAHAGHPTGLLSTVRIETGARTEPAAFTTPPAPDFHRLLAEMRDAGCAFAAVEASSHGLDQRRIAGLRVAVAGYTNLSRDHLDYHGTMAAYADAKAILFRELADRAAVCVDDAFGCVLARDFAGPTLTIATATGPDGALARAADGGGADVALASPRLTLAGSEADLHTPDGLTRRLVTRLVGAHNLQNAALAVTMAHLAGLTWESALAGLAVAGGAPGRLERCIGPEGGPAVFVDYAHTPDALGQVLATVRAVAAASPGARLVCVFGAGGDRDRGKRPEMAREAARHADRIVLTSDNPRSEDPEAILDDVAAGLPAGAEALRITDRRAAIHAAVSMASPSDVIVIAGKGHEDYQIVGDVRLAFDDRAVAAEALATRGCREVRS